MHLTPHEMDKLTLHAAGFLAQKRLARGLRLNYPESVALISTQILEFIRDGKSVAELMDLGRRLLGRAEVQDGVPETIQEVQVEGTFPDGSKLVTVHRPIVAEHGRLDWALYGSFLPIPSAKLFRRQVQASGEPLAGAAGELLVAPGELELNAGRATCSLKVVNSGDRPIQVGSHYPFVEANRALVFDRVRAYGMRLDIPAGAAVRFEPGEIKTVPLVALAGRRVIRGGNLLANGPVHGKNRAKVAQAARRRRFGHKEQKP